MIRQAEYKDKNQFRKLWDICFSDSENFRNWFFENRFIPSYSVCVEEDGQIVSEMQSMPYNIKVRDSVLDGTLVAGVCTLPEHTKKGYMNNMYRYYLNLMYEKGVSVNVNTPVAIATYQRAGLYTTSDTSFITIEKSLGCECEETVSADMKECESMLYECYVNAAKRYSGIIYRSMADFRLKCDDYSADGGKCIAYVKDGKCLAYAIYYDMEELLHAEEVMSADEKSEQIIADAITELGKGKRVTIKLPPDSKTVSLQGKKETAPRNVGTIVNASKVLEAVGKGIDNTVCITESVIEENNGTFDMCGNKTDKPAQIEMPVYRLAQWIFGYRSLAEMEEAGEIKVYDKMAMEFLDERFPKQVCHIIDEY